MADYESTTTVDARAEDLFEYLSKVENLPTYMDRMTSAKNLPGDEVSVEATVEPGDVGASGEERTVGGEAWFTIDADHMKLAWGAEGPHDYKGELEVTPDGAASQVTVRLHTMHDAPGIEDGIEQTLANIQRLAGDGALNPGASTD
jgi:uncharacterized membrane protein